jgi:protein-L-isoaspartate(D-aspartate) O-methyltransferase
MNKKELIKSLRRRGFSEKIIRAFEKIKREEFIPEEEQKYAYEDIALPIGYMQTISQPYTIAFMLDLLELKDGQKILEVGSGSGYVLALISQISKNGKIFGVERIKELAENSRKKLEKYKNIKIIHGSGFRGLKEEAPFDRILVSASARSIPEALIRQLKYNGILVIPVRNSILKIKKTKKGSKIDEFPGFVFVPLIEE